MTVEWYLLGLPETENNREVTDCHGLPGRDHRRKYAAFFRTQRGKAVESSLHMPHGYTAPLAHRAATHRSVG
jgi:hypothetical protein